MLPAATTYFENTNFNPDFNVTALFYD